MAVKAALESVVSIPWNALDLSIHNLATADSMVLFLNNSSPFVNMQ